MKYSKGHVTRTIIDNGAAYMIILPATAMPPTTLDLTLVVWARVRVKMAKTPRNTSCPSIMSSNLFLGLRLEYIMKKIKYTDSIKKPVPLIVTTSKLCGWTIGSPNNIHIPQLTKVARYGTAENSSTDPLFTICMNVGLKCFINQLHTYNSI